MAARQTFMNSADNTTIIPESATPMSDHAARRLVRMFITLTEVETIEHFASFVFKTLSIYAKRLPLWLEQNHERRWL